MARDPELQQQFKQRILEHFNKLNSIQEFGEKKHTTMWCMAATANHFLLKTKTIQNYIYS